MSLCHREFPNYCYYTTYKEELYKKKHIKELILKYLCNLTNLTIPTIFGIRVQMLGIQLSYGDGPGWLTNCKTDWFDAFETELLKLLATHTG